MKTKLPIVFLFALLISFFAVSRTFAFKAELVPRTPLAQRDMYDTDVFTGSATYSYDVPVPKGTNNLTPKISLDYSSVGVRDTSSNAGIGWQLNKEYIERDVNYTPSGDNSDDIFRLHFQGGVHELVYVSSEGWYHTKIESGLHIKKFTTGGSNETGEYWIVTTKDGTKFRFGYASQSENMCWGRGFVNTWNLDQVEDTHGNKIFYTYTEENTSSYNFSYLTKIEYNTEKARVIEFIYDTNPYSHEIHIQSCRVQETKRLKNIAINTNGAFTKQFNLSYTEAGNYQQLLQSITETGNATASALPATAFEYKPEIKKWASTSATWINNASVDAHLQMSQIALSDVNGDGLSDIVKSFENNPQNGWDTWKVLLNQGNSWSTSYSQWLTDDMDAYLGQANTTLTDVTGDGRADIIKSDLNGSNATWKVWRNTGTSWDSSQETWVNNANIDASLTQAGTKLYDVNGDGLSDIVKTYVDGSNSIWKVFKNTGSSWNTTSETWITSTGDIHLDQAFTRLFDVNGDGLLDIVKTSTGSTWWVWKNSGQGWITSSETWLNDSSLQAYLDKPEVAVSDVNGDNLPDIVKSFDGGSQDKWKVLLNKGNSWSTTWEEWVSPSDNIDADVQTDYTRLADVNGDGLSDIVKTSESGENNTWIVWKNNKS